MGCNTPFYLIITRQLPKRSKLQMSKWKLRIISYLLHSYNLAYSYPSIVLHGMANKIPRLGYKSYETQNFNKIHIPQNTISSCILFWSFLPIIFNFRRLGNFLLSFLERFLIPFLNGFGWGLGGFRISNFGKFLFCLLLCFITSLLILRLGGNLLNLQWIILNILVNFI